MPILWGTVGKNASVSNDAGVSSIGAAPLPELM